MIRRSPSEFYQKFLVTNPRNYSDDYIQRRLALLGLDDLGSAYLESLRAEYPKPAPFYPRDRSHLPSQKFINEQRIYTLYFQDEATRCALKILEEPRLKEFVESMTLAGATVPVMAKGAARLSNTKVTEEGVRKFHHYFWNVSLVDFTEMRAIVSRRGSNSEDSDYKKAFYRDSRKVASDLPFSPLSAALSQIRMGITPRNINFAELMERVRVVAGIKAYQLVLEDGLKSSEMARNFIATAQIATELMEKSHKPEAKLIEQFHSLSIDTDNRPIPHVAQLSAGRHTTDLQMIETKQSVVEVEDES